MTNVEGRASALEGCMTSTESRVAKFEKQTKGALASTAALIQRANTPRKDGAVDLNLGVVMSSHQKGPVLRAGTSISLN